MVPKEWRHRDIHLRYFVFYTLSLAQCGQIFNSSLSLHATTTTLKPLVISFHSNPFRLISQPYQLPPKRHSDSVCRWVSSRDRLTHLIISIRSSRTASFKHRQSEKPHYLPCHSSKRSGTPLIARISLHRSMRGETAKSTLPAPQATLRMLEKLKIRPQVQPSWMATYSDP